MKTHPTDICAALLLAAVTPNFGADGLRVYHIGNSHTDSLRNTLMPMAIAAGHTKHFYSTSIILGAPLRWIIEHDRDCREQPWSQGLTPANAWDAATLQCYSNEEKDIEAAVRFAGMLYKGNPKCRIIIYTIWPGADDDWENPKHERTEARTEKYVAAIAQAFPDASPPRVAPTSLVMRELGRLADNGDLPGVPSRFALLCDGGHLDKAGHYAVNATICSMLYNEPPFAYATRIAGYHRESRDTKEIDPHKLQFQLAPETAAVIKRVVWDVLSTYPGAGMNTGLVIADRSLPAAIVKQPYRFAFKALNAAAPRWSLLDPAGQTLSSAHSTGGPDKSVCLTGLPVGLALAPDGTLSGIPVAAGQFAFTVRVNDDGKQFEKPFKLVVSEDTPLTIVGEVLPTIPLDEYCFRQLKAQGGVGRLSWTLADGKLPHGVMLAKPGILVGTPGEAGEFNFKVRVTDSHPAGPRRAETAFRWTIGPASPSALFVKTVAAPPTLDGKLDEPFWSLDQKIGTKAVFGAVWVVSKDWQKGGTVYVAVKVLDGPTGKTAKDAVHLFIDGMHNRELIYNQDDTHFVIRRDGKSTSVKGKPNWFLKCAAAEVEGGYVLEIAVPRNYFIGAGNWLPMGPKCVYGFDIAVDEGDKQVSQQVWRGSAKNAEDTSGFGSLVLTNAPAK